MAVGVEFRLDVAHLVEDEGREDDQDAHEDPRKRRAFETQAQVVDLREDDGETLEPDVQQSVYQCDVQVEEEHHGLREGQRERADQDHGRNFAACHVLAFEFRLAHQLVVAREFAQAARAAVQDVGGRSFGHQECEEHQCEPRKPHKFPDRPRPAACFDGEPADERTQNWTTDSTHAPDGHPVRSLGRGVDINDRGAAGGERRRAHKARDEAESQQHAEIRRESRGDLQHDEQRQGANVDRSTPDLRHLGHWRPQHRTNTISEHKQRQAQCRCDAADAKHFADIHDAGRVDGRADVDGEGEQADLESDPDFLDKAPVLWVFRVVGSEPVDNVRVAAFLRIDLGTAGGVGVGEVLVGV